MNHEWSLDGHRKWRTKAPPTPLYSFPVQKSQSGQREAAKGTDSPFIHLHDWREASRNSSAHPAVAVETRGCGWRRTSNPDKSRFVRVCTCLWVLWAWWKRLWTWACEDVQQVPPPPPPSMLNYICVSQLSGQNVQKNIQLISPCSPFFPHWGLCFCVWDSGMVCVCFTCEPTQYQDVFWKMSRQQLSQTNI